jgi:hypothetical protein
VHRLGVRDLLGGHVVHLVVAASVLGLVGVRSKKGGRRL